MTGLDSKIRQEDGGARGSVGWVAGFDCCYFCCFPGEGFYFSSFFLLGRFRSFFVLKVS